MFVGLLTPWIAQQFGFFFHGCGFFFPNGLLPGNGIMKIWWHVARYCYTNVVDTYFVLLTWVWAVSTTLHIWTLGCGERTSSKLASRNPAWENGRCNMVERSRQRTTSRFYSINSLVAKKEVLTSELSSGKGVFENIVLVESSVNNTFEVVGYSFALQPCSLWVIRFLQWVFGYYLNSLKPT